MSRHATVEELSSLLDLELERDARVRIEDHLSDCKGCRGRLEGLRAVVAELERLGRAAPPPTLGRELGRRLRWEREPMGPLERLERRMRGIPLQPSVAPVFAFVVALAAIMFFFVSGLERRKHGTPVILEAPAAVEREALAAGATESRVVAGRTLERREGLWVEQGLADREPIARFGPEDPMAEVWWPHLPDRAALARLGGPVRLLAGDDVVEIVYPPGAEE